MRHITPIGSGKGEDGGKTKEFHRYRSSVWRPSGCFKDI